MQSSCAYTLATAQVLLLFLCFALYHFDIFPALQRHSTETYSSVIASKLTILKSFKSFHQKEYLDPLKKSHKFYLGTKKNRETL